MVRRGRPLALLALGCACAFVGGRSSLALRSVAQEVAVAESYQALEAPVLRASDGEEMTLTSLWSEKEQAAVVFLRHFG